MSRNPAAVSQFERTLTISEAARATGMSRAAIEARVHRGSLPAEKVGTRLRIPLVALYEQGLMRQPVAATVSELLDRLAAQAEELGRRQERIAALEAELDRTRKRT